MTADRLIPFLAVAIVLVVTPGPDFAVVTKNAFAAGRRAGITTAMGVALGLTVWTCASLLGIDALMRISVVAFAVLKVAGAAYLIFLGIRTLFGALRSRSGARDQDTREGGRHARSSATAARAGNRSEHPSRRFFRQGLLCNLLNPKAAVIFTSIIPQFLAEGSSRELQLAALGGAFVVLVAVWLSIYSLFAGAAGIAARRPRYRRIVETITGCVLVGLGVRVATQARIGS